MKKFIVIVGFLAFVGFRNFGKVEKPLVLQQVELEMPFIATQILDMEASSQQHIVHTRLPESGRLKIVQTVALYVGGELLDSKEFSMEEIGRDVYFLSLVDPKFNLSTLGIVVNRPQNAGWSRNVYTGIFEDFFESFDFNGAFMVASLHEPLEINFDEDVLIGAFLWDNHTESVVYRLELYEDRELLAPYDAAILVTVNISLVE